MRSTYLDGAAAGAACGHWYWQQFCELLPAAGTIPEVVGDVLVAKPGGPHLMIVGPPGQTPSAFWESSSLAMPFFPQTTKVPVAKSWEVTCILWPQAAIESANITIRSRWIMR